MKIEVKTVSCESLPGIGMEVSVDPMICLRRLAKIAKADKSLKVRTTFDGDGILHCNVTSFALRNEKEHEGLFAMFVYWKRKGATLQLQLAAHRWNPDPPTYDAYVTAAKRMFQPIISEYNRTYGTSHRMRIESKKDLQPKMAPAAKKAFDHFVASANKSQLHPLDWEDFYRFVFICRTTRQQFYPEEIRWFCRRAGFSPEHADALGDAFYHCTEFFAWYRRGRR